MHERSAGGAGPAPERDPEREPERPAQPAPEVGGAPLAAHEAATAVPNGPAHAIDPPAAAGAATTSGPAMSEELKAVLRNMGAAGYRAGYEASLNRLHSDPHDSARVHFPDGAGREIRFVLEQVHGDAYMRGMHDHQRGLHEEAVWKDEGRVSREAILRVEPELKTALREMGAEGYDRGVWRRGGGAQQGARPAPAQHGRARARGRGRVPAVGRGGQGVRPGLRRPLPWGEPGRRRRPVPAGGLRQGGHGHRRGPAGGAPLRPARRQRPRRGTLAARDRRP